MTKVDRKRCLTAGQERIWFLERLNGPSGLYNEYACIRISGPLSTAALYQSLGAIARRHESLRWVVAEDRGACFGFARDEPHTDWLQAIDLEAIEDEGERERIYRSSASLGALRAFDLEAGPLCRVLLFRFSECRFAIAMVMHHIISDAWSMQIVVEDLCRTYRLISSGQIAPSDELDYRTSPSPASDHNHLKYWVEKLADAPPPVSLPVHRARPSVRTFAGAKQYFSIDSRINAMVQARIRNVHVTPFIFLLALWSAYLGMTAGARDLVIGTTTAGRHDKRTEALVGFFVNTLAIRILIQPADSFEQHLRRVRSVSLEALDHQKARFEQVVRALKLPRVGNRQPLFEAMFVYVNTPVLELALPKVEIRLTPEDITNSLSKFDIVCSFWETDESIRGLIDYSLELYDPAEITTHVMRFQHFVQHAVAQPHRSLQELLSVSARVPALVGELLAH